LPVALSHFGRQRSAPNCSESISSAALPMVGSAGVTATLIWLWSRRREYPRRRSIT
jgi:hypothetical protein